MTWDALWIRDLAHAVAWWQVFAAVALGFAAIYLSFAGSAWLLTRRILPRLGIGEVIDERPTLPGQIGFEIRQALVAVLVFAGYGLATVAAEHAGFVTIRWVETPLTFARDLALFFLWNELHFYVVHRLMHTRVLLRHVHAVHHRSVVPTPFSTFSLHWFEALALSSVMLAWLLLFPLGIGTVLLFPAVSLALNTIGHLNYALIRHARSEDLLAGCRRHTSHHTRSGNYGFYLPWLDRLFGT